MSVVAEASVPLEQNKENPNKTIWILAWPIVLLQSFQVINMLLDTYFVGRLPKEALTAVGSAGNITFLIFSLAMALSAAATALVSRFFGEGNQELYKKATRQILNLSFYGGVVFTVIGLFLNPFFAEHLLPASDVAAKHLMLQYLFYAMLSAPGLFILESLAGALNAIGDTKSPMRISGFQILLHIIFNMFLVLPQTKFFGMTIPGMGLGVVGAGIALATSQWISAIVYLMWVPKTPLGHCWNLYLPDFTWAKRILKIAAPAAVTWLLRVLSYVLLTKLLAGLPGYESSAAIAAARVGASVEMIAFMPAIGVGVASAILVGQNLGMKNPDRAEKLGWLAGHHAAAITALFGIILFCTAEPMTKMLLSTENGITDKTEIFHATVNYIRYVCITEAFFGYALTGMGGMQGAGDTIRPLWITAISMILIRMPICWFLAYPMKLGADGCWIGMSVTQALQGIMAIWVFKLGAWKTVKV